jgi:hypothetical protein
MIGPGQYDDLCTLVRDKSNATGAIIIVIDGAQGSGFSCQCTTGVLSKLPELLESLARQIRRDRQNNGNTPP